MTSYLKRVRVAAYVICHDDEDRVLLTRFLDDDGPRWTLPGGGLDHGERPEDAALRELTEETGYVGRLGDLLGVDSFRQVRTGRPPEGYDGIDFHFVRVIYRAEIVGGELTYEVDGSSDRAEWFALDQVPDLDRFSLVDAGLELAGATRRAAPAAPPAQRE